MARSDDHDINERLRDHNDTVLPQLMAGAFEQLSPAQKRAVFRIADLFVSASAWRRTIGPDQAIWLDLDKMRRQTDGVR